MHLGNGAITPECAIVGCAAASAGLGYSLFLGRKQTGSGGDSRLVLKAIALGSFVFAAQMVNVPVLATSSAHFVGGVLLAELLGPALGATTMAVVLLLQAVLLGDGGLAALGVNIASMALVPAGVVGLVKRFVAQQSIRAAVASVVSIALAVLLIGGAVALGRSTSELATWPQFVATLAAAHLPVLVLEAVVSVGLLMLWKRAQSLESQGAWQTSAVVTAFALLVIALSGAVSSDLPDGYESAAQRAMPLLIEQD